MKTNRKLFRLKSNFQAVCTEKIFYTEQHCDISSSIQERPAPTFVYPFPTVGTTSRAPGCITGNKSLRKLAHAIYRDSFQHYNWNISSEKIG